MKLLTVSGSAGTRSLVDGLSGVGPPPTLTMSHCVCDLDVTRRTLAIAFAPNTSSEDRFVKSKRSLDVGDDDEVRDGDPILRRHLIGFLFDLYLAHA